MPSLFSIMSCSYIQTVEIYQLNYSIPYAAPEMTKKVGHQKNDPPFLINNYPILIPVKIERNIQLDAKVAAHIEYAGAAGNIIHSCIF